MFGSLIGSLCGFLLFILLLEAPGMGNVWYRNERFNIGGIISFITNPFIGLTLWHPSLWCHNWILMTLFGFVIGLSYDISYTWFLIFRYSCYINHITLVNGRLHHYIFWKLKQLSLKILYLNNNGRFYLHIMMCSIEYLM